MKSESMTLALAVLIVLSAGCAREEVGEEAVVADAGIAAEPVDVVEPVDTTTSGLISWDSNRDGMLDENEFNGFFNNDDRFADWDLDNDNGLSETEFQTVNAGWGDAPGGVDENGLFDTWDADEDGLVDNDEFTKGIYSTWDRDSNNLIDTNEYDAGINWFGER